MILDVLKFDLTILFIALVKNKNLNVWNIIFKEEILIYIFRIIKLYNFILLCSL